MDPMTLCHEKLTGIFKDSGLPFGCEIRIHDRFSGLAIHGWIKNDGKDVPATLAEQDAGHVVQACKDAGILVLDAQIDINWLNQNLGTRFLQPFVLTGRFLQFTSIKSLNTAIKKPHEGMPVALVGPTPHFMASKEMPLVRSLRNVYAR